MAAVTGEDVGFAAAADCVPVNFASVPARKAGRREKQRLKSAARLVPRERGARKTAGAYCRVQEADFVRQTRRFRRPRPSSENFGRPPLARGRLKSKRRLLHRESGASFVGKGVWHLPGRHPDIGKGVWHLPGRLPDIGKGMWHLPRRLPDTGKAVWHLPRRLPDIGKAVWHLPGRLPGIGKAVWHLAAWLPGSGKGRGPGVQFVHGPPVPKV